MSPVVYAVPYQPPAPPRNPWQGISLRWEGPDGTVWPMCGPRSGGIRLLAGARGLTEPAREVFVDETAGTSGARWRGHRDVAREVFWPTAVWNDTDDAAWLAYDAAWWRSLDPETPGRWVAENPNGSERHLLCRFLSDGDPAWESTPGSRAWARYGIRMLAVDPYWRGAPVARSWSGAAVGGTSFYGAGGPPLTIGSSSTLGSAQVTNPGDMPAHPVWWVQNVTSVDLMVGGGLIQVPAVAADKLLVVDADPRELSAVEIDAPDPGATPAEQDAWVAERLPTGTDRAKQLGDDTTWGQIPARSTTQVGIDMTGTGTVGVRFVPRYRRAW